MFVAIVLVPERQPSAGEDERAHDPRPQLIAHAREWMPKRREIEQRLTHCAPSARESLRVRPSSLCDAPPHADDAYACARAPEQAQTPATQTPPPQLQSSSNERGGPTPSIGLRSALSGLYGDSSVRRAECRGRGYYILRNRVHFGLVRLLGVDLFRDLRNLSVEVAYGGCECAYVGHLVPSFLEKCAICGDFVFAGAPIVL